MAINIEIGEQSGSTITLTVVIPQAMLTRVDKRLRAAAKPAGDLATCRELPTVLAVAGLRKNIDALREQLKALEVEEAETRTRLEQRAIDGPTASRRLRDIAETREGLQFELDAVLPQLPPAVAVAKADAEACLQEQVAKADGKAGKKRDAARDALANAVVGCLEDVLVGNTAGGCVHTARWSSQNTVHRELDAMLEPVAPTYAKRTQSPQMVSMRINDHASVLVPLTPA